MDNQPELTGDLLSEEAPEAVEAPDISEDLEPRKKGGSKLGVPLVVLFGVLLLVGLWWGSRTLGQGSGAGTLRINEVCTANHQCLTAGELGTPDWVELYNGSNTAVNLSGYGITDNVKQSYKFTLPEVTIEPGEYLLLYFVGGSEAADNEPLATGFGLSRYGETLLLVDSNYTLIDSVEVPALESDVSFARSADGTWGYCVLPTPGEENGEDLVREWN